MGLTIHWTLGLPASETPERVMSMLSEMQIVAAREMKKASKVIRYNDFVLGGEVIQKFTGTEGFFLWSTESVCDPRINMLKRKLDVSTAIGFAGDPGNESESGAFGLVRPMAGSGAKNLDWYWHGFCKTQYASKISGEHFLKCHKSIVAVLDAAVAVGLKVQVSDEGEYWETRDDAVLLKHVGHMNHIMAAFGGRLADSGLKVEAEIFSHPDFERLEMGEVE